MGNLADLVAVVELASLTEDRSDAEQHALLRISAKVDNELNAAVARNDRVGPPSCWLNHVRYSRVLIDKQKAVDLSPKEQAVWQRKVDRWRETPEERAAAERQEVVHA